VPILTLPQARRLVVHALICRHLSNDDAIAIVDYHLRRNAIAYQSHSKKQRGWQGDA
jgi:hypothetical protein